MKILSYLKSTFSQGPKYIIFFVTSKCNARCAMCFNWDTIQNQEKNDELTIEEIEKFSKKLGKIDRLTFSGGEPTIHPHLAKIARYFHQNNGLKSLVIPTNGINSEKIYQIVWDILVENPKLHLKLCLSLDGPEEIHNKIRGVKNNYQKLLATYQYALDIKKTFPDRDFEIQVNSTISQYNKNMYFDLLDCVNKDFPKAFFNITLARGNFPPLNSGFNPNYNQMDTYSTIDQLSHVEYRELTNYRQTYIEENFTSKRFILSKFVDSLRLVSDELILKRLKNKSRTESCVAGSKLLILTEKGDCYPCETLWRRDDFKLGNIRDCDYDYSRIIKSEKYKNIINFIKKKKCSCTFENAILSSIAYSPMQWPMVAKQYIKMIFGQQKLGQN